MAEYLPVELITEILKNLPVKSLNRFKCVSKTWNSIITSSKFIKHHLRQTLISNINTNIIVSQKSILYSAISTVKLHFGILNHPLNNIRHCPPIDVVESVHGLLLIVDSSKKTVCLFNPSNKTQRLVPLAPSRKPACEIKINDMFGLGYDSVSDDYKVFRLVQWAVRKGSGSYSETSVYSMRNDSWESVNDETSVSYTLLQVNAVSVEERLYFAVASRDYKMVLKCFDLRTSTFSTVDSPEIEFDYCSGYKVMSLRNLRGCLCLLVSYRNNTFEFLYADVWEMKEYKWVKLFRIQMKEIHEHCEYIRIVTYSEDEKSVLIEVDGIWFGWYDLVTKKFKRVRVRGLGARVSPNMAFTYVDTLISAVNNKEGTMPEKTIDKDDFVFGIQD